MRRVEKDNKELTFHYLYTGTLMLFQIIVGVMVSIGGLMTAVSMRSINFTILLALEIITVGLMFVVRKFSYNIDPYGWRWNIYYQVFIIVTTVIYQGMNNGKSEIILGYIIPFLIIIYYLKKRHVFFRPEE